MVGRDHFQAALGGQNLGTIPGGLKVVPGHDQLGPKRPHRGVLAGAVPFRYHDGYMEAYGSAGKARLWP
jgi:hypothetical protein